MPVRSLSSPVLTWPDAHAVDFAVRRWAGEIAQRRHGVLRIGYFGSYARGDWGVGSDLDVVIVVEQDPHPFERRAGDWDTTELPVPADVLVYTRQEWEALSVSGDRLARILKHEAVWVFLRASSGAGG